MKILLVHQYFLEPDDPGGSRFNEMTKVWADQGHQITVLCGMVNYVTGKKPIKYKGKWVHTSNCHQNIRVIRSYVSKLYNRSFYGRFWAYFSFVISSIYAGIFKATQHYDVIITTSPPLFLGITAYILKTIKNIPLVFEVRDLWPESAIETGVITNRLMIKWSYKFERFIYNVSNRIVVLTPAYLENLVLIKNIEEEKISVIPNGSDFTLSDQLFDSEESIHLRNKLGLNNAFVIIYVGAHGLANNLIQLLEAAEILRNTTAHFLLLGDGMEKPGLIKEAHRRKLSNITFIDPVAKNDVFKYIFASDVGVAVLKKTDTFKTIYSNKTFDYMACGKPVIAAIDGVTRKLIEQARCGSYVEPENPMHMSETLQQYIDNAQLVKEQGMNGYHYAKDHFDRKKLALQYLQELGVLA